jgi:hypothetical protein
VIKEAASCSCPTVVVEGGTTAQGIFDCENGFIAKNQPCEYALKVKQIITTEQLASKAGYGALNTLYKSWEDIVKKVYERYDYLLTRKHVYSGLINERCEVNGANANANRMEFR